MKNIFLSEQFKRMQKLAGIIAENEKATPKFTIGDKVKIIPFPKWKGTIWDVWINEPENLQTDPTTGEYIYTVVTDKPGRVPNMVQFSDFKESELMHV